MAVAAPATTSIHSGTGSLMAHYSLISRIRVKNHLLTCSCTQIVPEFNIFSYLDLHLVDLVSLFFLNSYKDEKMQVCVLLFYYLQNHFSSFVLVVDPFFSSLLSPSHEGIGRQKMNIYGSHGNCSHFNGA